MTGTAERLSSVNARIAAAASRSGRSPEDVTVVAVGKAQPLHLLEAAYEAGQRDFGENRAQELAVKQPLLPDDVRWHFVGPLQRNKVRVVRPAVAMLHSLDRLRLATAWAEGESPPPVLVEVNLGDEPQKGGISEAGAAALVEAALDLGLDVRGLMAIPPMTPDAEQARPYFARLASLRERIARDYPSLVELSMGMTADYEVAVEEGATLVRVGQAIFGPRSG